MRTRTLSEIKRHNKRIGCHFFDRGNPPVLSKKKNYLITRGVGGGFVVFKYNPKTGNIHFIDNPHRSYSWQPYKTKLEAKRYVSELAK